MKTELEEGHVDSSNQARKRIPSARTGGGGYFGAFHFAGNVPVGEIAEFYGLPIPQAEKATPIGDFIAGRLPAKPTVGDAIGIGAIGLVVHGVDGERITAVGLERYGDGAAGATAERNAGDLGRAAEVAGA